MSLKYDKSIKILFYRLVAKMVLSLHFIAGNKIEFLSGFQMICELMKVIDIYGKVQVRRFQYNKKFLK